MKTKSGFVSNSSSTSFYLYGISLALCDLREFVKKLDLNLNEQQKLILDQLTDDCDDDYCENIEKFIELCIKNIPIQNLSYHLNFEHERCWIGVDPEKIDEDLTIREFKKNVNDVFHKIDNSLEPSWMEESFSN